MDSRSQYIGYPILISPLAVLVCSESSGDCFNSYWHLGHLSFQSEVCVKIFHTAQYKSIICMGTCRARFLLMMLPNQNVTQPGESLYHRRAQ